MIDLNDMVIFAKVAEKQGISAGARALRMPKSKVSRHMSSLEAALGVRLLERTTRAVHLTEIGEIYYGHCKRIVEEESSARESIAHLMETPRGHLKISASVAIGQNLIAPHLSEFMALYPDIEIEIQLENRRVDPIREGYDVVIRLGTLEDSSFVSKPLGEDHLLLVASPNYLKQKGTPQQINDLNNHQFLVMADSRDFNHWVLIGPNNRKETVNIRRYAALNDLSMIRQIAIDGGGVALLPRYMCGNELLETGKLHQILPTWRSPSFKYYALYPSRAGATLKLRAWLEFLSSKLS